MLCQLGPCIPAHRGAAALRPSRQVFVHVCELLGTEGQSLMQHYHRRAEGVVKACVAQSCSGLFWKLVSLTCRLVSGNVHCNNCSALG